MKEFFVGLLEFIGSIIVTIILMPIGFIYSLGYSIWLSITIKKWYAFFLFWWRFIDGMFASLGYILHSFAYSLDLMWNVNDELIEDIITHEEHSEFSKKNITVSASVGKLEIEDDILPTSKEGWVS
jgi:hypothetical protein